MKQNDIYADSLDQNEFNNLNPKKSKSKDKNISQDMEISIYGLKSKFNTALEKLGQSDTRQMAMKQLTKLIQDFRNQDTLRIYLSILKGLKRNAPNSATKEHQVLVIAYICQKYKQNLIDPVDKPPSLMKTAFRVVELIHNYFSDQSLTVKQACARALIDLYSSCIKKQSVQNRISLIFLPLASIMTTGMDRLSQSTASVCINQLIQYWYTNKQYQIIKRIQRQILFVFFKTNPQFYQILSAISICLDLSGLDFFQNKFTQFMTKIITFLNDSSYNNGRNNSNQFNAYMSKVQACKMIQKIAVMIQSNDNYLNQIKPIDILGQLQKSSKNRIIQVQKASYKALKAWRILLKLEDQKPDQQENQKPKVAPYKLISLNEMRQKFKRQKSFSKQDSEQKAKNFEKIQQQLKFMKQDLSVLVKGKGWGPQNRGHNFVKKGSGVGGGHVGKLQLSPGSNKNRKTYQNHLKQLKKFVQQQRKKKSPQIIEDKIFVKQPKYKFKQDKFYTANFIEDNRIKIQQNNHVQQQNSKIAKKPSSRSQNNKNIRQQQNNKNLRQEQNKTNEIQFQIQNNIGQEAVLENGNHKNNKNNNIQNDIKQEKNKTSEQQINKKMNFLKRSQITSKNQFLSKEQMQQIMKNQQFQNVSSYLGDILDQADLINNQSKLNLMNSKILQNDKQYQQFRQQRQLQKSQKSFQKKSNSQYAQTPTIKNLKMQTDSLSLSNSKNKIFQQKMEQSLKLELSKYQDQRQSRKLEDSIKKSHKQSPRSIIKNVNFQIPEIKIIPNVGSENAYNNQISKDRFSSLQPPSQNQQQVEEQVISMYQQSKEAINQYNNKSQKSASQKYIKQIQNYQAANFQNLIKKPPQNILNTSKESQFKSSNKSIKQQPVQSGSKSTSKNELLVEWKDILDMVDNGNLNQAFQNAFQMDDSIYLLRLMLLTGANIDNLTSQNIKKLWTKFLSIYQSKFFQVLILSTFGQANQLGLIGKTLNLKQSNFLMNKLYQMSGYFNGKLSYSSANLYNQIQKKLKQ